MKSNSNFRILFVVPFAIFFGLNLSAYAQNSINYSYDDNGNRINRSITLKKSSVVSDTVYNDQIEKEIFKDEIDELHIQIFPNPIKETLTVQVSELFQEKMLEYQVFNSSGALLKHQKISEKHFNIDFKTNPSGIYILKLYIDGNIREWKIIKE